MSSAPAPTVSLSGLFLCGNMTHKMHHNKPSCVQEIIISQ